MKSISTASRVIVAAALISAAGGWLTGCDQQSAPPAGGGGGGGGGGAGSGDPTTTSGTAGTSDPSGPAGQVSHQPKSTLGKAADSARQQRQAIMDRQAEASAAASEISGEGQGLEFNGVKFVAPAGWQKLPASGMRAAELKAIAPDMEPETGTCSIVVFTFKPGEGGNTQMNIDRWKKQFQVDGGGAAEPEIGRRTIAGLPVTTVALDGTYTEMTPQGSAGQPKRGWSFRGAIVESSRGNVIIRMTGPREAVNALQKDWSAMIDGMTQ